MKFSNLIIMNMLVISSSAQADYLCENSASGQKLIIHEAHHTSVGDTSVALILNGDITQYYGKVELPVGKINRKQVIALYPFQGAKLTLTTSSKSCGRGSCEYDPTFPFANAHLVAGSFDSYFSCHETAP